MRMIYLDGAATAPPRPEALEELKNPELLGNPSSLHAAGRLAAARLERARGTVAKALGCAADEIIFTSGGTEADALAILGCPVPSGVSRENKHIVFTALEHPAVYKQIKRLEARGWTSTAVMPGQNGSVSAASVADAVRDDTCLVTCMSVCSENGAVLPLADIVGAVKAKKPRLPVHTDAAQGFLKTDVNVARTGVDMLSLSAHKVGGLRGAGALYVRRGLNVRPLWEGGGQENGIRSGTEPLPLIAALAAATDAHRPGETAAMRGLLEYTADKLTSMFPKLLLVPPYEAPHILVFAMPGAPAQVVQRMLSDEGICVSAGSACGRGRVSPALKAMRLPKDTAECAIRVSLHYQSTKADIDALCDALTGIYDRLSLY